MAEMVNACWLMGNFFERQEIIEPIIYSFNDGVSFEYLQSILQEISCFSEKHLVILNDWPLFQGTKQKFQKYFIGLLQHLSKECVVILNNIDTQSEIFVREFSKIGKIFKFEQFLDRNHAQLWMKKKLSGREKQINDESITLLINSFGQDVKEINIDRLYILLEKLCAYVGHLKVIREEDVICVCIDSSELITWTLFDLIDDKNYCEIMILISKHLIKESNVPNALISILNIVLWRYRLLFLIKEALQIEKDEQKLIEKVLSLSKLEKTGTGFNAIYTISLLKDGKSKSLYSEGMVRSLIKGNYKHKPAVMCYERKVLFKIVYALEASLSKIRNGLIDTEVMMLFNNLMMFMCNKVDYNSVKYSWSKINE
jgi:DNA polymerase III delta subunit